MERREVSGSREVGEPRRTRMEGKAKAVVSATRGQLWRPNWLPDGWIVEVSVGEDGGQVEHYTSPVSKKTFSSKEEVLHYLRVTKFDDHVSDTSFSEHNKPNVVGQGRNSPEWLPRGWILEIKTRLSGDQVGNKYMSYFDPFSGSRFYSKSEVLHFVKSGNLYTPTSGEKQRFKANATDNVLAQIEYSPVGLPQGWIKETKFRKSNSSSGIRRDPYYTDPVSGYVFRSLKDAIHYVETGERGPYAFGPRKCSINEMYSLEKESPLPIPVKELTSPGFSRRCLFTEEASTSNGEDIQQTKVGTDKKRRTPEADDPVNTSKYGEQKAKRIRPPKKGSKLEKEKEESEEFLEPAMIVEKSYEPPTEVTPVAREGKQQRSNGELASLLRRSSKRLAGLDAAPATDLVIHRPSCQLRSNGMSNWIEKSVPFAEPGRMETVEAASLAEHLLLTGQTYEDKPPSLEKTVTVLGFQKSDSTSFPDIQQTKVGTDKKRRRMPEADPVNTSMHGEQKAKRIRPPEWGSKLEKEMVESEEFLEPAMIIEKSYEPPTEVTPVARERKQRRSKGELASLHRRSSKRLAGLEAAHATDLIIPRPSCQLRSNGRSIRIEKSVPFAESGRMETVEAASLAEHLLLTGQTYEDKPPSHQPLSNGWCKGIEESAAVKEPERKDTAYDASQGEQLLLTGQTSEAKPPSRQPLSNGWCNGIIEESAPLILIEPKRKDIADEISQREAGRASEDKPSSSQLLSNGGRNGFKESTPLIEDTADEASQREQVLLTGQASEDRPPSRQPLSNGGFKVIKESALSVEPERMDAAEGAPQGGQVLLTGQTSQDRPSSPLALTFGSCWDDPCIQFAVKTLTGELPVLDVGIAIDEYVQKQLSSAEVLSPSPSAASVAPDNLDFDLAKLLGPVDLPRAQNLPVNDEGKPCPSEIGLPSHSEASRARGLTNRVQG